MLNYSDKDSCIMVYNIVCVFDYKYVQHAAVMLCSLFENNLNKYFSIYCITDTKSYYLLNKIEDRGISDIEKLTNLCKQYKAELFIFPCSLESIQDLPVGQWSTFMYLKLFMPILLPNEIERCLFLDVDMVINDNIDSLYNIELDNNVIAAAEDIPDCIKYKPRLHLLEEDIYINSGVMVCDMIRWREMQRRCDIFDFARSISTNIRNEQDVLAVYFRRSIKIIPIKWNMVTFYFMQTPKIFKRYIPQLRAARRNPSIIHFAAPIKPWFSDCTHPYRGLYHKYLLKTPWSDVVFARFEDLSLFQRFKRKIRLFLLSCGILKDSMYLIK